MGCCMGKYKVGDYIATNLLGRFHKVLVLAQVTEIHGTQVHYAVVQGKDIGKTEFSIDSSYCDSTRILTEKDMETYRLLHG